MGQGTDCRAEPCFMTCPAAGEPGGRRSETFPALPLCRQRPDDRRNPENTPATIMHNNAGKQRMHFNSNLEPLRQPRIGMFPFLPGSTRAVSLAGVLTLNSTTFATVRVKLDVPLIEERVLGLRRPSLGAKYQDAGDFERAG